jgi:hypothetical protein
MVGAAGQRGLKESRLSAGIYKTQPRRGLTVHDLFSLITHHDIAAELVAPVSLGILA